MTHSISGSDLQAICLIMSTSRERKWKKWVKKIIFNNNHYDTSVINDTSDDLWWSHFSFFSWVNRRIRMRHQGNGKRNKKRCLGTSSVLEYIMSIILMKRDYKKMCCWNQLLAKQSQPQQILSQFILNPIHYIYDMFWKQLYFTIIILH